MMLRPKVQFAGVPPPRVAGAVSSTNPFVSVKEADPDEGPLEVRPCGMLVQKRENGPAVKVPKIRVKVKLAGVYHEIYISSQATFGELKKMVSERTGMHPEDQKLVFKDKERSSKDFLDTAGVKDGSKIAALEDPAGQAKRMIEERRVEMMEKASKSVSKIGRDVDKLVTKVTALENIVNKGGNVVENDLVHLTELLMNELLKLDGIVAEGDAKTQRRLQVKRVQKYIETLDAIKARNAKIRADLHAGQPKKMAPKPAQPQYKDMKIQLPGTQAQYPQQQIRQKFQSPPPTVATIRETPTWEMSDLLSSMPSTSSSSTATTASTASSMPVMRLEWELF